MPRFEDVRWGTRIISQSKSRDGSKSFLIFQLRQYILHTTQDFNRPKSLQMNRVGLHCVTRQGLLNTSALPLRWPCKRNSSTSPTSLEASSSFVKRHTHVKGETIDNEVASSSPSIQALAARLNLKDIPSSTLARTMIDTSSSLKFVNNGGLSKFGKTLLSLRVYEHFMAKYPRLPSQVLAHVVDSYTGMMPLSEIGQMWGVQPDTCSPLSRYLKSHTDEQVLGRLSYTDRIEQVEPGVTKISTQSAQSTDLVNATGAFVRALVAAVYAHKGYEFANKFILDHIVLPRKIDISRVMAFSRPTRELAVLCAREGLEPPLSRLMAESGRYSSQAVFVVGVFSGNSKLGEGQGSSLREARTRAAVNALQSWYLYSPSSAVLENAKLENRAAYIDAGEVVI